MPVVDITPAPSAEEAAAITAAVQVLLQASCAGADADARPAAYRSQWRRAAIHEGTGVPADTRRSR
jgi:hypothetical protein